MPESVRGIPSRLFFSPGEAHPAHPPVRSARLLYLGHTLVSCDSKALSFIESLVMYRGWSEQKEIPNLACCPPHPALLFPLTFPTLPAQALQSQK